MLLLLLSCVQTTEVTPPPAGLLLVTVDTWRADHMSAEFSPNAWAVAQSGANYTNAWSPIGLTTPAHATIMTGFLPHKHGVRGNNHHGYELGAEQLTLAESLSNQGYTTAAFVSAWPAGPNGGLEQGFESFSGPESGERTSSVAVSEAEIWIESQEGPWFAWVHLYEPHGPYSPSAEDDIFGEGDRARYAGEVHAADRLAGPLYELAKATNSALIITSDHGEVLDEELEHYGQCNWQHSRSATDGVLRVPLIVAGPEVTPAVYDDRVGLNDIFSTAHELLGLTAPSVEGAGSLLPPNNRETWVGESGLCDESCATGCEPAGVEGKDLAVFQGGNVLIQRPGIGFLGEVGLVSELEGILTPTALGAEAEVQPELARELGYLE